MIYKVAVQDARYPLDKSAGSDAIHRDPVYSYAVTQLLDEGGWTGTGLAFTLGAGNDLVCQAANYYAQRLIGHDIEAVMADFGNLFRAWSNDPQFRWLGPHKGVVHLALASVTNACYDLWAKKRGVPLWKLLLDLSPEALVQTLDFSYLEDEMTAEDALALLTSQQNDRRSREGILQSGYPGYDTSVGWFNYSDEQVRSNCQQALDAGFSAIKLKVGSEDAERDIRRAYLLREVAGPEVKIMLDANQQWNLPKAKAVCKKLAAMNPFWIEEPTHPDDIQAHQTLAQEIAPVKLALGEHVPNKVLFKNYLQTQSAAFIQVDAVRVGGVSEFLTISLLSKKFGIPVVPHVGDMGQLHQHLVLFNHIAMGHKALFLEHIPHLKKHFVHPVRINHGVYETPQEPGSSCDLLGV
ncbi:enolase C-terminal domain-like protein [Siphonobacter curvatus]|uniref:Mandelate racemase n=1 Tax=Siphonobacter curvatus TaxID=2094562 RepID=A0A2S7IKB5_9BACT|nr:enolase C-terminal domain-like protein [Siphonobacter curvatus]PQA56936.1 mandelate racemase [Siphonobacter curvatus]